jgi:hypothetical protein
MEEASSMEHFMQDTPWSATVLDLNFLRPADSSQRGPTTGVVIAEDHVVHVTGQTRAQLERRRRQVVDDPLNVCLL